MIMLEANKPRDISLNSDEYSAEVTYIVRGDVDEIADEIDVKNYVLGNVPLFYDYILYDSIESITRLNDQYYEVVVSYKGIATEEEEDVEAPKSRLTFNTTGGTQHISHGLSLVAKYGDKSSDITSAAINFDGEKVNGVDITIPIFNFTQTVTLKDSTVTDRFLENIEKSTGKINSSSFKWFNKHEVLFLGASGSQGGEEGDWEITYSFSASRTLKNLTFGEIKVPEKKGWDYLWVQYQETEDPKKKTIVPKAIAVYIDKVYEDTSFNNLGTDE